MQAVMISGTEIPGPKVKIDPLGRMDRRNAALALGKTTQTLANWKSQNIGPRCFVVGGRTYYMADEILAYGYGHD